MDGRGRTFLLLQVFFCFFVFASTEEAKQNCSQVQCPGPLTYYHDVGCTPVYKNEGDCCAYKYNCDHLDSRSPNKCYIKHRSYEVGEFVNREDIDRFDKTCVCVAGTDSSSFWCFYTRYLHSPLLDTNCYQKRNINEWAPATLICAKNESEIPRCVVDGYTYMGRQFFPPKNEPRKFCMCQESYTGDNIEPFCITSNLKCTLEYYDNKEIANNNAPVYDSHENPANSCASSWSHQNADDTVIPNPNGPTASKENSSGEEDLTCKFGNLTMNIGDELSRNGDYDSKCTRCVCQVPPTPTCKRLNDNDCNSADNSPGRK